MTRRIRFRLWAIAFDLCAALRLPNHWRLRCVTGMSDATDWGPGAKCGEGEPF